MPLLLMRKPGGKYYSPVQDLREVNKKVEDFHPMIPNPYTLLSQSKPQLLWYTVLDIKDVLFSIPLAN